MCFAELGAQALKMLPAVIGSALSGTGTYLQQQDENKINSDVADARNKVLSETLARNDPISNKTIGMARTDQARYSPANVKAVQADATADRTASGNAVATLPGNAQTSTADSSDIVKKEIAKQMSKAIAGGKADVKRSAALGGFGDQWFRQGVNTDATSRDIGVQSDFAGSNLALLPHLQDFAENKARRPLSPIGGILQGIGNTLGSIG